MSWSPRAFLFKGFLADKEAQHLIDKARLAGPKKSNADSEGALA